LIHFLLFKFIKKLWSLWKEHLFDLKKNYNSLFKNIRFFYYLKHLCIGLIFFILVSGCEDVVDVELSNAEPRLVVDALIGFNDFLVTPIIVGQVVLTLSAPFFDEQIPVAEGATVQIIDNFTGEAFTLEESDPGVFDSGFPDLEFGRDYTLVVLYNGERYEATEQLVRTGTIDNIEQGDGFLFDEEEETEVIISFSDVPDERNFYLFSFGFDNFLTTDDEFYQNSSLTFSYFYEDVNPGDRFTIILLGIDQRFSSFVDIVLTQSQGSAGLFATPPADVRGNIINTTNSENFAFGYFSISEFDAVPLVIE